MSPEDAIKIENELLRKAALKFNGNKTDKAVAAAYLDAANMLRTRRDAAVEAGPSDGP